MSLLRVEARKSLEEHPHFFQVGLFSPETASSPGGCGSSFAAIGSAKAVLWIPGLRSDEGASEVAASPKAHLEIEVLHAFLLDKPIWVLHLSGEEPTSEEIELLGWIERIQPKARRYVSSSSELAKTLREANVGRHRSWISLAGRAMASYLDNKLKGLDDIDIVEFMGGPVSWPAATRRRLDTVDESAIRRLLEEERQTVSLPHRLLLIWRAFRQLYLTPYSEPGNEALLPLWSAVLGRWSSAMAWSGGHGPAVLSRLAALNSMRQIRKRALASGHFFASPELKNSVESTLASELYSISKRLPWTPRGISWSRNCLRKAEGIIDGLLEEGEQKPSGLLSMRGYVKLRQFRFSSAVEDFERASEMLNGTAAEAEGRADLGFALLFTGRIGTARRQLEKGVEELRTRQISGFLVRAERQLAWAQILSGQLWKAADTQRRLQHYREELRKPPKDGPA